MDYKTFYAELFRPLEERVGGKVDAATLMAIVGIDFGGPVSLCTIGHGRSAFVSFITCELAVRKEQKPASFGRYELMMTCNDQAWAWRLLTRLGQMSLDKPFGNGHTVDIEDLVESECQIKGLIAEKLFVVRIEDNEVGILEFHGITQRELSFARAYGADRMFECLKQGQAYAQTDVQRRHSVALTL
ncbi:MAG: suppressor of fused domain protein [Planctomycetes bacterium]|nr:suppressor of fused domain protein [Planctomycetota bacterium]